MQRSERGSREDILQRVTPRMRDTVATLAMKHTLPSIVFVMIKDPVRESRFCAYAQILQVPDIDPTTGGFGVKLITPAFEINQDTVSTISVIEAHLQSSQDIPVVCDPTIAADISKGEGSIEFVGESHYRLVGRPAHPPIEMFTEYNVEYITPDIPGARRAFKIVAEESSPSED